MRIISARTAAPSFKALRLAGETRMPKIGERPVWDVIVATDEDGRKWQHCHIFKRGALETVRKIRGTMEINPTHWRLTNKGEY